MSKYRASLPQLSNKMFLTDGGIETTLIFLKGFALPHFASFPLLRDDKGREALRDYYCAYAEIAKRSGSGMILESATWRANADWGSKLSYSTYDLAEINREAISFLSDIRSLYESDDRPVVISGCVGPKGDGYVPDSAMSSAQAENYHSQQVGVFAETAADMVCGITINYVEEAIGIALAARDSKIPVAIAFTVETDGNLPTGQSLRSAIEQVDAETGGFPAYFMVSCAHPTHFQSTIEKKEPWVERIHGLRANASRMSHAELDEAKELDSGNPEEFGREYADLKDRLPQLNVFGGCCGTDHRHIEQVAITCSSKF